MATRRQMSLSIDELLVELSSSEIQKCLIINEIGTACLEGEDTAGKGEKVLVSLLTDEDSVSSRIAYCYLATSDDMSKRNKESLKLWREDPKNNQFVDEIEKMITRGKQL